VYDSYHIPADEWAAVLGPGGALSLRGTPADGLFIALWLDARDGDARLLPGGWDGFYTYFSSEAVSHGANPANWPALAAWARRHRRLFIPSVGPGYNDQRIRPWNAAATRRREGGRRYRRWWDAAAAVGPWAVSITSFNEWVRPPGHPTSGERGPCRRSSAANHMAGAGDGSGPRQPVNLQSQRRLRARRRCRERAPRLSLHRCLPRLRMAARPHMSRMGRWQAGTSSCT
jgi:glycoprotein endo-alpha-1,2-mannosidase